MTNDKQPTTIKKYANRRLYNTGTSAYVTLEDLASMVKRGEDFVVYDAKSSEDITHSVLTQIIFEQEGKGGQSLLPITFLRQLIRFYGDSMQMLVPRYLEFSIDRLTSEQDKFRDHAESSFGSKLGGQMFAPLEEQARKNMAMFTQALSMFNPFALSQQAATPATAEVAPTAEPAGTRSDFDDMRRQLDDLRKRVEGMAPKPAEGE
jgi:polyhydroxyalkanoate synthesis repressor PhaR